MDGDSSDHKRVWNLNFWTLNSLHARDSKLKPSRGNWNLEALISSTTPFKNNNCYKNEKQQSPGVPPNNFSENFTKVPVKNALVEFTFSKVAGWRLVSLLKADLTTVFLEILWNYQNQQFQPFNVWSPLKGHTYWNKHAVLSCKLV